MGRRGEKVKEINKLKGEKLRELIPLIKAKHGTIDDFVESLNFDYRGRSAFYRWLEGSWPHNATAFEAKIVEVLSLTENPFTRLRREESETQARLEQKKEPEPEGPRIIKWQRKNLEEIEASLRHMLEVIDRARKEEKE